MAFASVESSGGRKWSEGELRVEDEFTCSAALRGAVLALQATVKRVFDVELDISVEEGVEVHQTGLMWLQLKGKSGDVLAAKHFVRGVVNQEEQQEVTYPEVLHCVFCGARGLFMDCLIRNTSAHIMVGSPGCLLISGLAEPVVRAYSLIVDLVERYDSSQGRRMDAGARGTGESLDSRRAFKDLVERWDDRHTLDLLVLPVSVKEILLELVRESRWNMATAAAQETVMPQMDMDEPEVVDQSATSMNRLSHRMPAEQLDTSLLSPGSSVVPTRSDVGSPLSQQHQGVVLPSATPGREPPDPFFRSFAVVDGAPQGQVEAADEQQGWRGSVPQEVMDEASRMEVSAGAEAGGRQDDLGLLLKFFTAMGFKEDTVNRVLSRTGPLDPCDLLELVQQEQGLEDRGGGGEEDISRRSGDGAEEEPNFSGRAVEKGALSYSTGFGDRSPGEGLRSSGGGEEKGEVDDDFVLGVVKRAAASCGYPEDQVREVFSNLPELSSHQLLLELQRQGKRDGKPLGTNITEAAAAAATATLTAQQRAKESLTDSSRKEGGEVTRRKEEESGALRVAEGKASVDNRNKDKDGVSQGKLLGRQPSAKAMVSFDSDGLVEHREIEKFLIDQAYRNSSQEASAKSATPVVTESHDNVHKRPPVAGAGGGNTRTQNWNTLHHQNHQNHPRGPSRVDPTRNGGSSSIRGPPRPRYPHEMHFPDQMNPNMLAAMPGFFSRPHQRPGLPQMGTGAIVTGQQRFLEGLQMPFELKLSGDTGDSSLRQIIIDGSNVAMSHGLGQYFSCRGIALAVQHFWDRGHRKISALVPQWRQKRDPRVKEQDYMFRLQDLGLLSFTPSREVMGKRINSYDDRFMLQLAQKTNGVIVTNDNMRDLFDESDDFKDIIRKSLLQYTFVGDHFMVPDDPLGRDGPHLNDFLRSHQSTRTFSGSSFTNPPAQHQRPQPEPLQFHNRPPGGNRVTPEFQSNHLDLQSQGWEQVQRRGGRGGGGGRGRMEPQMQRQRSAEETSRLRASLMQVFPDQASTVDQVLQTHPALTDINRLSGFILEP